MLKVVITANAQDNVVLMGKTLTCVSHVVSFEDQVREEILLSWIPSTCLYSIYFDHTVWWLLAISRQVRINFPRKKKEEEKSGTLIPKITLDYIGKAKGLYY